MVTVKEKLSYCIDDFSVLVKQLCEAIVVDPKPSTYGQPPSANSSHVNTILQKLNSRDKETQQLVDDALEMRVKKKELAEAEAELTRTKEAVTKLQKRLQDAEKLLEGSLYQAKELLKSAEQANKSPVESQQLIQFSHHISLSNSTVSPVGWQPSDPRRPYPHDIEMRGGFLGKLSSSLSEVPGSDVAERNDLNKKLKLDSPPLRSFQATLE
ncbi:mediator of RNA polymerase II transcription subunit 4-like isoform X2 [Dysidea avara]|uniref:mediator of RNA polymerase II transcription subunit 4-like isoform X2 n=1 Tax=Dysidea avara TaxID=196820 RepID=UPI00332E07E3